MSPSPTALISLVEDGAPLRDKAIHYPEVVNPEWISPHPPTPCILEEGSTEARQTDNPLVNRGRGEAGVVAPARAPSPCEGEQLCFRVKPLVWQAWEAATAFGV